MKRFTRFSSVILGAVTICAVWPQSLFADDGCGAILNLSLEQTSSTNLLTLDQKIMRYYESDEFRSDVENRKFNAGITVKGIPLSLGASSDDFEKWKRKVKRKSDQSLSVDDRRYFFETRGLSTIANAWLACHTNNLKVDASIIEGDGEAIVTISHKGFGATAQIESILTIGCEQLKEGMRPFGSHPIRPNRDFEATGIAARFRKHHNHPNPVIVIQTSIGFGIVSLKQWPPPPVVVDAVPPPSERIVYVEKVIDGEGGWPCIRGDNDMDTDGGDVVPVRVEGRIEVTDQNAVLKTKFTCSEDGGDRTKFSGTRSFSLYKAPSGTKIVRVTTSGGLSSTVTGNVRDENYGWNRAASARINGTFWKKLRYKVDSSDDDDRPAVGISGTVTLKVILRETGPN